MSRYPTGQQPPLPQYEMTGMPVQHHPQQQQQAQYPQANQYYGGNPQIQPQYQYQYQQQQQQPPPVVFVQVGHHHPPSSHAGAPQHRQPQQQQYLADFGSNPQCQGAAHEYDRGQSVRTLILQGEPIYSQEDIQRNPELKTFRSAGYQDVWAALLFLVSFLGTVIVAIINGAKGKITFSSTGSGPTIDGESFAEALLKGAGVGIGVSLAICIILLILMRAAPYGFIVVSNVLVVCGFLALAIWGFVIGSAALGVIGILLTLLVGGWLYCVRHMIPFSALILECSTHVVLKEFGAVGYAFVALVIAVGYYIAWLCMIVPTLNDLNSGDNKNTAAGVSVIFLFMVYWAFEVFHNVAHVTSAGVMATWYFIGERDMPASASSASFVRAITTSFGSICFGSLVVAILKTIEMLVRTAMRNNRNSFAACIALCLIQCIEALARYFNRLAYSFVGIFGCSYTDAAKMTWEFVMEGSVWGTLINDILLERVFVLVNLVQTGIAAAIVWFAFRSWVALLGAILISFGTGTIIFNVVDSASVTLMVASATCPEVFAEKHPALREKLLHAIEQLRRDACCGDDGENGDV